MRLRHLPSILGRAASVVYLARRLANRLISLFTTCLIHCGKQKNAKALPSFDFFVSCRCQTTTENVNKKIPLKRNKERFFYSFMPVLKGRAIFLGDNNFVKILLSLLELGPLTRFLQKTELATRAGVFLSTYPDVRFLLYFFFLPS